VSTESVGAHWQKYFDGPFMSWCTHKVKRLLEDPLDLRVEKRSNWFGEASLGTRAHNAYQSECSLKKRE
jgi:hypothetical protein